MTGWKIDLQSHFHTVLIFTKSKVLPWQLWPGFFTSYLLFNTKTLSLRVKCWIWVDRSETGDWGEQVSSEESCCRSQPSSLIGWARVTWLNAGLWLVSASRLRLWEVDKCILTPSHWTWVACWGLFKNISSNNISHQHLNICPGLSWSRTCF